MATIATAISCECGKKVKAHIYEKHIKTKQHLYVIRPKKTDLSYKQQQYEQNKDLNNCCKNCLKTDIPPCYYISHTNLCVCCSQILAGGTRLCRICKQDKPVELMERPYLYYCKSCANIRIQKPMDCECGATISLSTKYKHQQSQKHLRAMADRLNSK